MSGNKPRKRRKKDELGVLPYICGDKTCNKSYKSYPALYTHIKLKHGGVEPPGTIRTR